MLPLPQLFNMLDTKSTTRSIMFPPSRMIITFGEVHLLGSLLLLLLLLLGVITLFLRSGLNTLLLLLFLLLFLLDSDKEANNFLGLDHVVLINVELLEDVVNF